MKSLSGEELLDWQEYDRLNPIGDLRGDWQAASICSTMTNIAAQRGRSPKRFNTKDFLLRWIDGPQQAPPEHKKFMPWQQMRMIAQMMTVASEADARKRR